jgi:hypothetical protein
LPIGLGGLCVTLFAFIRLISIVYHSHNITPSGDICILWLVVMKISLNPKFEENRQNINLRYFVSIPLTSRYFSSHVNLLGLGKLFLDCQ